MSDWIEKARAMRETGLSYEKIGAVIGVRGERVRRALNPQAMGNARAYYALRKEEFRATPKASDGEIIVRHVYREPPPRRDPMPDCVAFARGEIDRSELSRRLRGAE